MALVPALDLSPKADANHPPNSLELEQAVLGILLYDNAAAERLPEGLDPKHFYEPFHGRLFGAISKDLGAGKLVDAMLMWERFTKDPALAELGDVRYLADLVDRAPPSSHAFDYGVQIMDTYLRRRLMSVADDTRKMAVDGHVDGTPVSGRELVGLAEQELFELGEAKATAGVVSFSDALAQAVGNVARAHERGGGLSGTSTGLIDLDRLLGGLHPTDLIILGARPSMGKTALATNIAFHVAKTYRFSIDAEQNRIVHTGGIVLFFSLEMAADQLGIRVLSQVTGINSEKLRRGEVTGEDFGKVRDGAVLIQDSPLYIDDTGGIALAKLAARARRLKRTVGLDFIVVDYLQLVDGQAKGQDNRTRELSLITGGLKALAKELKVPVLALAQLSRQVENREDKKPQLADLRESGSIEQDADVVMFLYREEYYLSRTEPKEHTAEHQDWQEQMEAVRGKAEVIVGKQRHGPIGTVPLAFDGKTTTFSNLQRGGSGIDFSQARLPHSE